MIEKKTTKRDLSIFLRPWYVRGFKLFWEKQPDLRFNC